MRFFKRYEHNCIFFFLSSYFFVQKSEKPARKFWARFFVLVSELAGEIITPSLHGSEELEGRSPLEIQVY